MTQKQQLKQLRRYNNFLQQLLSQTTPPTTCWWGVVWETLEKMMEVSIKATTNPKGKYEKRTRNRKVSRT